MVKLKLILNFDTLVVNFVIGGVPEKEKYPPVSEFDTKCDGKEVKRQSLIAICLNIGHVIIGYSICWPAPVFPKLQNPEHTPLTRAMTDVEATWLAGIFHLGCITGSQSGAFLSNVIGRKYTLMLFAVVLSGSNVVMLLADNFTTILIGRTCMGVGVGALSSGDLVYIGEIASSHLRGIILTSTGVLHTIGGLLIFSVGPYVSFATVEYILIMLTIIHVSALTFIPESPVYHVIKGNDEDAKNTLCYLGRSKDINSELKTMIDNATERRKLYADTNKTKCMLPRWTWLDLFRRSRNRRALAITSTLMFVQEGAGAVCIMSFATSIFKKAGSSVDPDVATILLGVTQVCGILLSSFLIERFGRRVLLIFSTSVCALCMALLSAHFYLELINHPIQASIRWLPLVSLISFLLGYNAGLGIVPNVLLGEMFSPNVRSVGSSISMGVCSLTAFATSISYGYIIMAIGSHAIFILFAIVNVLGCIFTIKFVPETKKKGLTEIEAMLAK